MICLNMNIFNVVVWSSLFLVVTGENYYISSHDASDWKTATKQCNLAEPELIYSSDGVTVNMQNVPATITTEDVWIGYYIARTALEYFGCAKVESYKPTYITKADPGYCLSACGVDKEIGISGNKCFCFNKGENIGNGSTIFPNCDQTCNDLSRIVCGKSDHENSFMSLYRSIGPHNITWTSSDNENWKDATRACFEDRKRPSTYNNTQSASATHFDRWTGIVRSHVIYKYTTYQSLSKYAAKYVYIGHNDGDPVVKATRSSSYFTWNKLLCLNDSTTNSLPTTTTLTHVTTTETKTSGTSPGSLQVSTYSHNMTHSLLQANQKGSSNIGVIVGASSSAVTVVVIAIVVIVVIRRRGTKEKPPPHQMGVHHNNAYAMSATHPNQQNTDSQDEYADIDMATEATGDEPESDYAHDYFILEKTSDNTFDRTKDKRVKKNDKGASNPYNNSGYEDGPYDTSKGVNQKPNEPGFNPYNHIGGYEEESSEYDHIGKNKSTTAGPGATDTENTYITTTNPGFLKNSADHKLSDFEMERSDYDHIGKEKSGHATSRKGDDDDNTYNTTDLGFLKTSAGAPDNIYNVTGENDVEDTYSHINDRKWHQTGFKGSENDYDTFKK